MRFKAAGGKVNQGTLDDAHVTGTEVMSHASFVDAAQQQVAFNAPAYSSLWWCPSPATFPESALVENAASRDTVKL